MKIKSIMTYLFFTFIVPIAVKAQEAQEAAGEAAEAVTETAGAVAGAAAMTQGANVMQSSGTALPMIVNKAIDYVAQIGNLFGNVSGLRIGGTTGTAIATLIIAKLIENKAPSWVKWVLYATGGTMFAGSGANLTQLVTQIISG